MKPPKKKYGNITKLVDRSVVRVSGPDRLKFLQNLLTCNVDLLAEQGILFGGLLTPQGKILFDFFLINSDDTVLVDIQATFLPGFIEKLNKYRLHADVAVQNMKDSHTVLSIWNCKEDASAKEFAHQDPRLPELGFRTICKIEDFKGIRSSGKFSLSGLDEYHIYRMHLGVPAGDYDFSYGQTFPHDVNMDSLNGIDFSKGCFVGQEVVSRVKHRGTARKCMVIAKANRPLPHAGTEIYSSGMAIGTLRGNAVHIGIAQIRIDRAKPIIDKSEYVTANEDVEVKLKFPDWTDLI